jgi:uncharacterized protein (DUF983 family)
MPVLLARLGRALRLRCPRCGEAGAMASWFRMHERCSACDLDLDRNESGYQVGSYLVAMIVIELLFVGIFLAILAATWPTPPWDALSIGGPLLMLLGPLVLFPFTKTIYLAMDLTLRPDEDA